MESRRIAVLGLYRSGSTVVAGVLQRLGVDMGAPFYGEYYESDWLSKQLRFWWDEPRLREKVAQPKRIRILSEWIQRREQTGAKWVGMKHPLLSLCGEDLVKAWGEETKFIRCCRPLNESVESMKRGMGYRGDAQLVQSTLLEALDRFFASRRHLEISFADMMNNPGREIHRAIEFLQITPGNDDIASALQFVQPGQQAKVENEMKATRADSKQSNARRLLKQAQNLFSSRQE